MKRRNFALWLALILLAGLVVILLLPLFRDLPDPQEGVLMLQDGGRMRPPPYQPGELGYLLGSDLVGRDLFSRIVYGARTTLGLALLINLLRFVAAVPVGLWASWRRGWLGRFVQAAAVGFSAIPALVLVAIALAGLRPLLGTNGWLVAYVIMLVLSGAPRMAEQVRRRAEEIILLPHVEAAQAVGAPPRRILQRHVLPVMRSDLLVMASSEMAWVLLTMAQLAVFGLYLGGTVAIETTTGNMHYAEYLAEWGQMLGAHRTNILRFPWLPIYPGLALGLSAAAFHLLAEGLRVRSLRH